MKKLLVLIMALVSIFCLAFTASAVCYEDYDIANLDTIAEKISNYSAGGENKENGELDGNLDTGIATSWNGTDGNNVIYKYSKSHLVRKITVTFNNEVGHGYDLELSNDGGVSWTKVKAVMISETDALGKQTVTYDVQGGAGMDMNTFKFTYRGAVTTYKLTLYEIDITASKIIECNWDEGITLSGPTCGDDGNILYTCQDCYDENLVSIPATGVHEWEDAVETKPATSTENGELSYKCKHCDVTKTEVIPAVGHNWDDGTVVAPKCEENGYTLYKCTDDGCTLTYTSNPTEKVGHSYDEGVITEYPSVYKKGVKTFSCVREGCEEFYTEDVPEATYNDSSFFVGKENILRVEETLVNPDKASDRRDAYGMFDGKTSGGGQSDGAAAGGWFAPSGSSVLITFDETYRVFKINIYGWSNWNSVKVEFLGVDGSVVAEYANSGYQELGGGYIQVSNTTNKHVKAVRVTSVSAKADSGNCLVIHEIQIIAHKHLTTEDKARYDETEATCIKEGSYKKHCYICDEEIVVETPKSTTHSLSTNALYENGYNYSGVIANSCSGCTYKEVIKEIPALVVSLGYSCREGDIAGVSQKVLVSLEAITEYNKYASTPIQIGMVAGTRAVLSEGNPLVVNEGVVTTVSSKLLMTGLKDMGQGYIDYSIVGFGSNYFDTQLILSAYIYDGTSILYLSEGDFNESITTRSYNELLVATLPPVNEEE